MKYKGYEIKERQGFIYNPVAIYNCEKAFAKDTFIDIEEAMRYIDDLEDGFIDIPYIKVPWSCIVNSKIGQFAKSQYDAEGRYYHNWDHIVRMYEIADNENMVYDPVLDYAILFHDIVYDGKGDHELRSGYLFADKASKFDIDLPYSERDKVCDIIKTTIYPDFRVRHFDALVYLDLHDLAFIERTSVNQKNVKREMMELYNITEKEYLKNSMIFFQSLLMEIDIKKYRFDKYSVGWDEIQFGIASLVKTQMETYFTKYG